jgi:hypothetical protein
MWREGRTYRDGHDEATSRYSQFCNRAFKKARKKGINNTLQFVSPLKYFNGDKIIENEMGWDMQHAWEVQETL